MSWETLLSLVGMGCLLMLLGGPAVRAQTPPSIQSVRFTVFAAKPISDLVFAPRATAPPQKVQFYPTARSPRYEYRGAMPVRFVDVTTGAVVAEANIPPEIHDALLLFAPIETGSTGAGALRYQISVLDDSAARNGAGGLVILNLSGLALTGTLNNQKLVLKAGLNPTVVVDRSGKLTLSTIFKERTYQAHASTITLGRNERALLILFPPFYHGSLEVQSRLLVDQASAPPAR